MKACEPHGIDFTAGISAFCQPQHGHFCCLHCCSLATSEVIDAAQPAIQAEQILYPGWRLMKGGMPNLPESQKWLVTPLLHYDIPWDTGLRSS